MSCCVRVRNLFYFFLYRRRLCRPQLGLKWCADHCPSNVLPRYVSSPATPANNNTELQHPLRNQYLGKRRAFYLGWVSFAALFRGGHCNPAWSVSPQLCGRGWIRAHSAALLAGPQLSCTCREGGGRAEEAAWRVTNLNNSWRQKGQVSALCFSYTVCVGCTWWRGKVSFSCSDVLSNSVSSKSWLLLLLFLFSNRKSVKSNRVGVMVP